jgi:hypothetical protein
MKRQVRLGQWLLLAALGFAGLAPTNVDAAVPTGITQQGRVLDADGNAIAGEVTMVFTAYDEATDGTSLWTETQSITLDEGYFSARLGEDSDNPFPDDFFDGSVRYIGITIGSDDELAPRERIASVPYAYHASEVTGDIHPASVTVGGVEVIDATGKIPVASISGKLPATQLTGFSSLLSTVDVAAASAAVVSSATAPCGAGKFATGGGCSVNSCPTPAMQGFVPKTDEPVVSGGKPTGWQCSMQFFDDPDAAGATTGCSVEAHAVCVSDN